MEKRTEEIVARWLEDELNGDDYIEREQENSLAEKEHIIHSPHDSDTDQEDSSNDEFEKKHR